MANIDILYYCITNMLRHVTSELCTLLCSNEAFLQVICVGKKEKGKHTKSTL